MMNCNHTINPHMPNQEDNMPAYLWSDGYYRTTPENELQGCCHFGVHTSAPNKIISKETEEFIITVLNMYKEDRCDLTFAINRIKQVLL